MRNLAPILENSSSFDTLLEQLGNHPIYRAIDDHRKLRIFMEHHVFAAWDFMSLVKAMQQHIAPVNIPWTPPHNPRFIKFINQLALEEESDDSLNAESIPLSHFESYVNAMNEIGANTSPINEFVSTVNKNGLYAAMRNNNIPAPSKKFMQFTFDIIASNQPHLIATVMAYSRETLVPVLFRCIRQNMAIASTDAPNFHAYLNRHIQLDEHSHGPIAMQIAQQFCFESTRFQVEAENVRQRALETRLMFWDEIHLALGAKN